MEFVGALIGAIFGAVASFALSEYSKRKNEHDRVFAALRAEVKLNLDVAKDVCDANGREINGKYQIKTGGWYEIIPFSETAWMAVMSTGALSHLHPDIIEPLSCAYAMVRRVNYIAVKMQYGRLGKWDVKEYTKRVLNSKRDLREALAALDKYH